MDVRVLPGAVPVLRRHERALDQEDPRAEELGRRVEDLGAAVSRIAEERDLFAARYFSSALAECGDLRSFQTLELALQLVPNLREEVADCRHAVSPRQELQLEVVPEHDALAGHGRRDMRPVV